MTVELGQTQACATIWNGVRYLSLQCLTSICPLHYLPIRCFIGFNACVGEAEIYDMISFVTIRQGPLDNASIGETKVICSKYEVLLHI